MQTCWAVMALIYARYPERGPIERGVRLVMGRQLDVSVSLFRVWEPGLGLRRFAVWFLESFVTEGAFSAG